MMNLFTFACTIKVDVRRSYYLLCFCFLSFNYIQLSAQSPCNAPHYNQFDFWVGDWEVYHTQADTIVGHNIIKRILNGCVVQENWTGATGFKGKSFNTFNSIDSTWNQVWVDVSGATYYFKGKMEENAMKLKGQTIGRNGQAILFKMSYTPDKNTGNVHQLWKQSSNKGENWQVIFDGIYKKKSR